MADTQPESAEAGSSIIEDQPPAPTGAAEDRKAAAALSSLDAAHDDADASNDAKGSSQADQKALGEAMSRLEILDKRAAADAEKEKERKGGGAKEEVSKKKIKVDAGDVALLVRPISFSLSLPLSHGATEGALSIRVGSGKLMVS